MYYCPLLLKDARALGAPIGRRADVGRQRTQMETASLWSRPVPVLRHCVPNEFIRMGMCGFA